MKLKHMQRASFMKMMEENKSLEEIAEKFESSVEEVTEYINSILNSYNAPSEAATNMSAEESDENKVPVEVDQAVYVETVKLLTNIGMEKQDAMNLINRTIPKLQEPPVDAEELKNACYRNFNPKDMMISSSENGNKGVMISTGAASNALDPIDAGGKGNHKPAQSRTGVYPINSPIGSNQNTRKV